jgi:sugar lactone lactonase YvrE
LGVSVAALCAYFTLWPVSIDPVAWQPPGARPSTGALASNEDLRAAERLAEGRVEGPEDVAVDAQGRVYVGVHDGRIEILARDDSSLTTLAETGGRPLGLAWAPSGDLLVADSIAGLLSVTRQGAVTVLSTESEGVPFGFTDDVDVAGDGRVYFSDASDKFGEGHHLDDLIEGRPHGRLLRYDPTAKTTETLLDGLYFANGVAVAADDSFVLVNETGRFRVMRYWLTGPQAGTSEPFCDELPGYPDGVSRSPRGTFWVALYTRRNPTADALAPHPWLRKVLWRLPAAFLPKPEPYGFVVELGADGEILRSLQDPHGDRAAFVTSVEEVDGTLWLGSLMQTSVARLPL